MARNEEKAQSMLARFRVAQKESLDAQGGRPKRRPWIASEVTSIKEAEKWRTDLLTQMAKKIKAIQNAGLGETRLRELNDQINRLQREKWHWDEQIVKLGGPNYHNVGPKMLDNEGKEIKGSHGYKYYGAAKNLPGVKELFEAQAPTKEETTKRVIFTRIDAEYFGYHDEEDGIILAQEAAAERIAAEECARAWAERVANGTCPTPADEHLRGADAFAQAIDEVGDLVGGSASAASMHVHIPTQADIERLLLDKKKKMLMMQYASAELVGQEQQARALAGLAP